MLPHNTRLKIKNVLYSPESRRNLLSFKNIRVNGYHIETTDEDRKEYLHIIACISGQKLVLEKLSVFSSRIYYTIMISIESNVVIHQKCSDPKQFILWDDQLGHPGSIMMT